MVVEFFSLFTGKALSPIHSFETEHGLYEHKRNALCKAYGKTAEGAKLTFFNATAAENETAVQANARITRLFDEHIQKEEIQLTYETLRVLMIKDKFEMCPLELVAIAKSQEISPSEKMIETVDLPFKVHGRNFPLSRPVGNKPQMSESKQAVSNKPAPNEPK